MTTSEGNAMSDRITDTIAEALAESFGTTVHCHLYQAAAAILAALRANRIRLVELPESDCRVEASEDENGYSEWSYPHGSIATTDDGTIMWGQWHITDPSKVRAAAAALLAAADVAEEER